MVTDGTASPSRPPLLVQIVFHPGSQPARELAVGLHRSLNGAGPVPGLCIPTVFTPEDGAERPPAAGTVEREAERVFVVVLDDDWLAAAPEAGEMEGRSWGQHLVDLYEACRAGDRHRFFPVQLSRHAWPIDERLAGVSFLRAWHLAPEERPTFLCRRVAHELCRHLLAEPLGSDGAPPLLTIFISHTKLDLDKEPPAVRSLIAHLTAEQPEKTWFDSGDIEAGSVFAERIEAGVENAAMIAVLTDSYASREWCRKEVLLAKRYRRPVIVVDALREQEVRSFPYTGNVPVLRWTGDPLKAIDLLHKESLRHLHARAVLEARKEPGDEVLPCPPELVTLVGLAPKTRVLYPDPPLGGEELNLLAHTGVVVETPLQRFAERVERLRLDKPIALSLSEPGDLPTYGLDLAHFDGMTTELSRYLLLAGARLAYGGHLGEGGYSQILYELVRCHSLPDVPPPERIVSYLGWPIPLGVEEKARYRAVARFIQTPRPADLDESLHPDFTAEPTGFAAEASPEHRYAWARGMTEMRERQTADTLARVILGGRTGPSHGVQPDGSRATKWYVSRIPGVLEEVLVSMQAGQPVFLIGAFGGCARLVFDLMEGRDRPEMSWAFQRAAPQAPGMRALYEGRDTWWGYREMTEYLRTRGFAGLNNRLDPDENRRLATTRVPALMIELLLEGLRRVCERA